MHASLCDMLTDTVQNTIEAEAALVEVVLKEEKEIINTPAALKLRP